MPYRTGDWGQQQKERSKRRLAYFRDYHRAKGHPPKVFRLGEFGELLAHRKLNGSKLVNETSHDLLWNNQRIEVKTSLSPIKNSYLFDIRIQKREDKTNFFFVLMLNQRTKVLEHAYLIPDEAIKAKVSLRITPGKSKYERYRLYLRER